MISIPKKVLIVDDEEDLTWSIARSLTKNNALFDVTCANSGPEALDYLYKSHFDLVITDIHMPGLNGLDLTLEIRKRYPDTKVIVMTAYGSPEMEEKVNKRGTSGYIEKPFEINTLKKMIFETITEPSEAFEGRLVNVRLEDIILMYCMSHNTAELSISNGREKGAVYFRNGEIVHAKCQDLVGEAALFNMLKWKKGNFKTTLGDYPPQKTINRGWQALLNGVKTVTEV